MGEWIKSSLGEIAELRFGKTPPRSETRYWNPPDGHPWATIADLRNDPVLETAETVSDAGLPLAGRSVLPGSVMMSFKLTVGRVARAGAKLLTNEAIVSVHGLEGRADDGWLYHALPGIARSGITDTAVKGSTLNKTALEKLRVHLPPLEEQRRIARVLDKIDESIRATERVISKHVRVRVGLARDLLAESSRCIPPPRLDERETEAPPAPTRTSTGLTSDEVLLKDCGCWLSGGTPDTGNPDYWGGEIPWITASSLKGRYLSTSGRRLTPAGARAGTRVVPPQTILFVIRGMSLKKEFRVGMTVRSVAFGQDCKALVPADGVDPKYLLFALEAAETDVLKMVDEATHGTGRLQTSLLGHLRIWLPAKDHQRRITAILDTIDETIQANEEQLGKLRQLRSGLAADLLSGRVSTVAA